MARKPLPEISKDILDKVNKAVKKGKYFIAVVEFKPDNDTDLSFHYAQYQFPNSEVFSSLKKISEMYQAETVKVVDDKK